MIRARRLALFALRLAVVIAIYVVIARHIDPAALAAAITPALAVAAVVAAAFTVAQTILNTLRWVWIGRSLAGRPGPVVSFFAYSEGLFVNQALPSFVGGDALRVARWRGWGVALGDAIASVLADRLYGVLGAGCLALVAIALLWGLAGGDAWLAVTAAIVAAGVAACGAVAGVAVHAARGWIPARPQVLQSAIARIARLRTTPRDAGFCLATALVGHGLAGCAALVIARVLGIDAPAGIIVFGTAFVMLLTMIPLTLAGWGLREAGYLVLLTPFGVASEKAVLLGIAVGAQGLLAALVGGVSLLLGLASRET